MKLFLYFLTFVLLGLFSIYINDYSVLPLFLFFFAFNVFFIKLFFDNNNFNKSLDVFCLSFCSYTIFVLLTEFLYVDSPLTHYFFTPDSIDFYSYISNLSLYSDYRHVELFDFTSFNVLNGGTGFLYFGWVISRISFFIGGSNSLIIHKLFCIISAAMINTVLYNSLILFFDKKKVYVYTLIYVFLSHNFIYSATFLRDLHVALLIALGMYLFLLKFNYKHFFIMLLLLIIIFTFRPSHALFFLIIILVYSLNSNLFKSLSFFLSSIIFLFFIFIFKDIVFTVVENMRVSAEFYQNHHFEGISNAGGSSVVLDFLPPFMHPIFLMIQSQIDPFIFGEPFRIQSSYIDGGQIQLLTYLYRVIAFFWSILVAYLIINIRSISMLPNKLKTIFFLSLLLIVFAGFSSNDSRRLLGVYPSIFICFIYLYSFLKVNRHHIPRILFFMLSVAFVHLLINL